jgi:regulator of PEP synthase PpsR (kinase-PPPase family)
VLEQNIPSLLEEPNTNLCVVGLFADAERLAEVRKTRVNVNTTIDLKTYTDVEKIRTEVETSKKMFKKFNWPSIDVTRRSVEETAASIIKIYEIKKNK